MCAHAHHCCRNIDSELSFIVPGILDSKFKKAQIFTTSKNLSDIVGMLLAKYTRQKLPLMSIVTWQYLVKRMLFF